MKVKKPLLLVASILLCEAAGIIGSVFTVGSIPTWYAFLNRPMFSPPNWLFGPVWTVLYLLMGISLYLVWKDAAKNRNAIWAVKVFFVHLAVNASWSIVFFGLRNISGSLIIITALWLMILYLISRFMKLNKLAAYLLYPYLAWVMFATVLNFSLWVLNM